MAKLTLWANLGQDRTGQGSRALDFCLAWPRELQPSCRENHRCCGAWWKHSLHAGQWREEEGEKAPGGGKSWWGLLSKAGGLALHTRPPTLRSWREEGVGSQHSRKCLKKHPTIFSRRCWGQWGEISEGPGRPAPHRTPRDLCMRCLRRAAGLSTPTLPLIRFQLSFPPSISILTSKAKRYSFF